MQHEQAIDIILQVIKKKRLTPREKQALLTAVGVLSWTKLAQSRLRSRRQRQTNS